MAEALLRRELTLNGIDATVSSAGLLRAGMQAADEVIELMDARDLDLREHRSQPITPELLAPMDLVIGMAREHVREVVLMQPALFSRTFTLKELVWRGREVGPRRPDEPFPSWLARLAPDRRPTEILGSSDDDDIEDPIGRRFAVFKKVTAEIETLTTEFVEMGWSRDPVPQ
jgi:protein-tyrosine-phosphatase